MKNERLQKIERLFQEALERAPADRDAFLDHACGTDSALRREVESLLAADDRAGSFMEEPAVRHGIELLSAGRDEPGPAEHVGHYKLLRKIGEGGMSDVYLAVRADDEYQKRVALKIIRHGRDRDDMLRRFRTERQILAGLDHPNIAKLLDGGTTREGSPYFVMDYIDGVPIDDYCDGNRLSIPERLRLFRTVCSAVQYAHQNLVVHRDLKASNILVTSDGVPKLLDFGIAKLLKPDQFAQEVEYTATWLRPMTPRYASPEQVQGKLVGTPSDVYSLGVLLYRLLTGHFPYQLEGRPPSELARLVVSSEPERPSAAVDRRQSLEGKAERGGISVTPESVAEARRTQPPQLRRQLVGDLDNVVLMALRKEPRRRYASVEQFSEDVRRHLEGLPVLARKDTLGYRSAKFLRRNRLAVGAVAAFLVVLLGFAITMTVQATRIAHERDQARLERDRAEQVVAFMEEIFEVTDPLEAEGENITATEILERGAERIVDELGDQPEIQATLMEAIGNVYRNLGLYDRSHPLLKRALEIRREVLGDRHPDVASSLHNLGILVRLMGDFDDAERMLQEALGLRRDLLGEEHLAVVETINHLGIALRKKGDYQAAERLYREALRIQQKTLGEHPELATAKNNLATLLLDMGDLAGAEPLFRESLELRRKLMGPKHPLVAQSLNNLGASLGMQGKYDEAEPLLREGLTMYREILDPEHPSLVEALNNLAKLLQRKGDLEESEQVYREAMEIERKRLGPGHPKLAHISSNLAELLQAKGSYGAAEAAAREALFIRRSALGERHVVVGESLVRLGSILVATGQPAAAEPLLEEGLEIYRDSLTEDHWRIFDGLSALGECLAALARFPEAESLLLEGYEGLKQKRGPDHPRTRAALARVVDLYSAWGRPDLAAEYGNRMPD